MRVKFYLTSSGRSPVEEFLSAKSQDIRDDFFDVISLLASGRNLTMPLSRSLSNFHKGLHELRLKDRCGQVRGIYYMKIGGAIYILHAFDKKRQQLSRKEIQITIRRIKEV